MKLGARTRRIILWSATSITVLLAVVWIESLWMDLILTLRGRGYVVIGAGALGLSNEETYPPGTSWLVMEVSRSTGQKEWKFDWDQLPYRTLVVIPLWAPLTLSAAITAFAWRKELIARRRANQHRCPVCGYDLAGLTETTPCPECGKRAGIA